MKMISIGSISPRQRSINKHQELVASIHSGAVGLQNPIVSLSGIGYYGIAVSRIKALGDV